MPRSLPVPRVLIAAVAGALLFAAPAQAASVTIGTPNGGASQYTNDTTPTFDLSGTWDTLDACDVDGTPVPCADPLTIPATGEGAHSVQVQVSDGGGSATDTRLFTIDTTPPTITDLEVEAPWTAGFTNDTTPRFLWNFGEAGTTFECSIDGGTAVSCLPTYEPLVPLLQGSHSFAVTGTDLAGNTTTASITFEVDTTFPTVSFDPGDPGFSATATPTFEPAADEPLYAPMTCEVAPNPAAPCGAAYTTPALAEGAHTLTVLARDRAGNLTTQPRNFTVDLTNPTVTVDSSPTADVTLVPGNDTAPLTFSAADANGIATRTCTLDRPVPLADLVDASCTSPKTYAASDLTQDGTYTFTIAVADSAGRTASAVASFDVDDRVTDLAITKTDDAPSPRLHIPAAGATVQYTLTATNNGPKTVPGATVTDTFPAAVSSASWTCAATPGSVCGAASGSGNIAQSVDVAAGGTVTFTVTATIAHGAATPVANTASIAVPAGWFDDTAANDTDSTSFAVNSDPVLTRSLASVAFTEGDPATTIDGAMTLADPEDAIAGATVTIAAGRGTGDTLAATVPPGITQSYDGGTGVLTLSGAGTAAQYQSVLRSVTFFNALDNPSSATRTIAFVATDSFGRTGSASVDVTFTAVNDAPTVTLSGSAPSYTEGGSAATVDGGLTLGDVDDTSLEGATVTIGDFVTGDVLAHGALPDGVSANFAAGVLTFTGSATPAQYQALLRSVTYASTSDDPTELLGGTPNTDRTVTFVVDDGTDPSAPQAKTVGVSAVNDPPVVTATGTELEYDSGTGAQAVDPGLGLTDPDSTALGTVTVAITTNYASGQDTLALPAQPSGITGAFSAGTLTLSAAGTPTVAQWRTALRAVTYANSSNAPSLLLRTVTFSVSDGSGGSDSDTRQIDVHDVTPPVLSALAMAPEHTSGRTNDQTPAFTWAADEPVTATCTVDGTPVSCSSPFTPASNLAEGPHTLTVDAVDQSGNASNQLSKAFTVDVTPPTFAFDPLTPQHGAQDFDTNTTPTNLAFTASETLDGGGRTCRLDGGAAAPCVSPYTTGALADGSHSLQVSGTDLAGNPGSSTRSFFVDTAPPAPTVDSGPAQPFTASQSATFTYSANDPAPSSGIATVTCTLDAAPTPCTFPKTGLAEGQHSFSVTHTDEAGNSASSAQYQWSIDLTPPQTSIDPPRPGLESGISPQGAPTYATRSTSATFTYSATDPLSGGPPPVASGVDEIQCRLDGGGFSTSGCGPFTGLAHGLHTFDVRAIDNVGHVGPAQSWPWFVDVVAPDITPTWPYPNARFNYFKQNDDIRAEYDCDDRQVLPGPTESGVASCVGTVAVGAPFDRTSLGAPIDDLTPRTYPFQIDTADNVGNTRSQSFSYRVYTFAGLVLDDDPAAYFRLDDTGEVLEDRSGNGNDGEYKNATSSGPVGISGDGDSARVFTGADGYGYVNDMPAPSSGEYTMAAFVRFDDGGDGMVMQHGRGGALFRRGGQLVFRQTSEEVAITVPGGIVPGCWYFVAGRWNGSTATVYAGTHDGATDCTPTSSSGYEWFAPQSVASSSGPSGAGSTFYVGYGEHAPWLRGMLDEVAYFDTDIGATHVEELWLADPPPSVPRAGSGHAASSSASRPPAATAPARPAAAKPAARVNALTRKLATARAKLRRLVRRGAPKSQVARARRDVTRLQRRLRAARRGG